MDVMPKPLPVDPAQVAGLSAKLLRSHYDNNYLGAVSKLNTIRKQIENTDREPVPGFALVGAKREELLAANSVFLHEAYFDALGGNGAIPQGGLSVALERDFGSEDNWRAEFRALAQAMGGAPVGRSWLGRSGRPEWSTTGRVITPNCWQGRQRCSRLICTSMRTTWTSEPTPQPTSTRSWHRYAGMQLLPHMLGLWLQPAHYCKSCRPKRQPKTMR